MGLIHSEKKIEYRLRTRMKEIGGECIKLVTLHHSGLPDRLCLFPGGKAVFVETKTTKAKAKKIQLLTHKVLRNMGFSVEIIDTVDEVRDIILRYA